jgi:hypothetical protein
MVKVPGLVLRFVFGEPKLKECALVSENVTEIVAAVPFALLLTGKVADVPGLMLWVSGPNPTTPPFRST